MDGEKIQQKQMQHGIIGGERQEPDGLAVYIHFPYCRSRCPYCDFFRALLPRAFDEEALLRRYADDLAILQRCAAGGA